MAYMEEISVFCTNKLCNYRGTGYQINGIRNTEKMVCPKCGFKTLTDRPVFNAEAIRKINEALEKAGLSHDQD